MADFCTDCSKEMFGEDTEDHKGLTTDMDTAKGLYVTVICESCGIIQVDHHGTCVSHDHRWIDGKHSWVDKPHG